MNAKTYIALGIIILLVVFTGAWYLTTNQERDAAIPPENTPTVSNFIECIEAGYPVLESYPRQCKTPLGATFVENIGNELEKRDLIRITMPRPNETIFSPLIIQGEARGVWYFEASFPIELIDANGNIVTQSFATAQGEWMTENFVPFETELVFTAPETLTGTLILRKDNPSGLPEHNDELRVPIQFETTSETGETLEL